MNRFPLFEPLALCCKRSDLLRFAAVLVFAAAIQHPATAQEEPPDSTWQTEATAKLSVTQAGFFRWHDGGVSALAISTGINATSERVTRSFEQSHELRLAYGLVKQNGVTLRKAEDVMHVRSSFALREIPSLGAFDPVLTLDFRSQFTDGFKYDPPDESDGSEPRISSFLSPAIFTQSAGLNIAPWSWINIRFGVAAKETLVKIRSLRSRYNVRSDALVRWEAGLNVLFLVDQEIFNNVHLKHSLSLFAAFNQSSLPDLISETLVTMTVNRWLQVNLEYTALLDRDVSKSLQMKEVVSLGFALNLL